MEIKQAEFVTSMAQYGNFAGKGLPQIAVAGKSNVGKSSLINKLCNRNKLAKTSATPGKTKLINVFLLNRSFHLIDLPGYGFARVDKAAALLQLPYLLWVGFALYLNFGVWRLNG